MFLNNIYSRYQQLTDFIWGWNCNWILIWATAREDVTPLFFNCSEVLSQVKEHTEQRLRTHLRKRHKIKDRGTGCLCFTGSSLYTKYGLYKVPTTAGWTNVHALRWRTSESRVRENRTHGLMREGWWRLLWHGHLGTVKRKGRKRISQAYGGDSQLSTLPKSTLRIIS